jgi:hypothetical protein
MRVPPAAVAALFLVAAACGSDSSGPGGGGPVGGTGMFQGTVSGVGIGMAASEQAERIG